jgi:hypothetical protein
VLTCGTAGKGLPRWSWRRPVLVDQPLQCFVPPPAEVLPLPLCKARSRITARSFNVEDEPAADCAFACSLRTFVSSMATLRPCRSKSINAVPTPTGLYSAGHQRNLAMTANAYTHMLRKIELDDASLLARLKSGDDVMRLDALMTERAREVLGRLFANRGWDPSEYRDWTRYLVVRPLVLAREHI